MARGIVFAGHIQFNKLLENSRVIGCQLRRFLEDLPRFNKLVLLSQHRPQHEIGGSSILRRSLDLFVKERNCVVWLAKPAIRVCQQYLRRY